MSHARLITILSLFLIASPALADFNAGMQAYRQKDYNRAIKEFKAGKDMYSNFNLGVMYFKGEGVKANPEAGMNLIRKSGDQGYLKAQLVLAGIYDKGEKGVPQDKAEAMKWYRKAAAKGDMNAQYAVGSMLLNVNRQVEEEERKEAIAWLKKSARQGHEGARKFLGVLKEEIPDVKKGKKAAPAKTPAGHP